MKLEAASQQVKDKLVALYDTKRLYEVARENRDEARCELITAMMDLFGEELNERERELVADILISLVRRAERTLRAHLAEQLAQRSDVPERLILTLANDKIDVAEPILRQSPCLSALDLVYIVKSMDAPYWRAIATRADIDDELMNALVDTQDPETAIALAENSNIELNTYSVKRLSSMACDHEDLAAPLVMRSDIPDSLIRMVYTHVGQAIRSYIYEHYPLDDEVQSEINDALARYADEPKRRFTPSHEELAQARAHLEAGRLNIKHMLDNLKQGQTTQFVAQFAAYSGLPVDVVQDICAQTNGQGLAIACRACHVQRADFVNLFLMTRHMSGGDPWIRDDEMQTALAYYNRISDKLAQRIMENSSADALKH
jgi:uncharacterized protein (DUF2336 family)